MKHRNGALAMGVAAAAVLAVVGGGAVAARRGPVTADTGAAPIPAGSSPKPSSAKPSVTPSPAPGSKPTPSSPRPVQTATATVELDLAKLPPGRTPQVAYLDGRVVKGGLGSDMTVPGKQDILRAVRYNGLLLVVVEVGEGGSELATVDEYDQSSGFGPDRIPDVASLVSSLDEQSVAFATARSNADHTRARGSVVYWRGPSGDQRRKLERPDDWGSTALAVVGDTVYFSSDTDQNGITSTLSSWDSGTGEVTRLKTFKSPAGVDYQGATGVDMIAGAAQTFCSAIKKLESGKQLWRTCEYSLNGFTPDGQTVFATPDFRNGGSDPFTAALNAGTGALERQWSGPHFLGAVAEDDDHLLMVADNGEGTPGAIIRCSVGTGACELATPLAKTPRYDLRLLGGWA